MEKVIFDTDPGIDDSMAILFAAACPEIKLLGLTTIFGNTTLEGTTKNALFLKEKFNLDYDVAMGEETPLFIRAGKCPSFVHGDNGLGNIKLPDIDLSKIHHLRAPEYIISKVREFPHEVTIMCVGRLTNLAKALMLDPDLAPLIKKVIIMGGAFGHHGAFGNVTPFAEANIAGDPHAADLVYTSELNIDTVGLDVTQEVIMNESYLQKLRDNCHKAGPFIYEISRFYYDFHKKSAGLDGFYVHDSSAVMCLVRPDLYTFEEGPVRVVCTGPAAGHTIQKTSTKAYPKDEWASSKALCKVAVEVNAQGFLDHYFKVLEVF